MPKFLNLKNREQVEKLALEKVKQMRPTCDCGGDPRYPEWHHEGCARDQAWDFAYDEAANEIGEYEWVEYEAR